MAVRHYRSNLYNYNGIYIYSTRAPPLGKGFFTILILMVVMDSLLFYWLSWISFWGVAAPAISGATRW